MFNKKFLTNSVIFFAILILGIFLRFYRFIPNLVLNGEMGTDYMNVLAMLHGTRTWLIGPRTSHEWFFIPPISYWIYIVLLWTGRFNPITVNVFWGVVGSLGIWVCYFYVKKLFDEKIALVSSFLVAVSPAWIDATRASRYNAPAAILFLPFLYYLRESILDKGKSLFKLGLILGLMMSFFPSPFLLIPAAIVGFIFYRSIPEIKNVFNFILGFLIPNFTFIIYEFSDKFTIIREIAIWIPYRVIGFFGLYHKNTVSGTVLYQNFTSIYNFFAQAFAGRTSPTGLIIFILIIAGLIFWSARLYSRRKKELSFYLLTISLLVSYIGLFVHGDPPEHYYYVIFPIPMILVGFILTKTFKNNLAPILITLLLGAISVSYLISANWYYQDAYLPNYTISLPSYSLQTDVANAIFKDSNGSVFSIGRIGIDDKFENDFANNYIYLLTLKGSKLNSNANIRYTIVEGRTSGRTAAGIKIWSKGGIDIYKFVR